MIPKLTTIADLEQTHDVRSQLISRAFTLVDIYHAWKSYDVGGYSYEVHIGGLKERAPGVHASEISKCLRQVVYSLIETVKKANVGEARDVGMQRRFDMGTAVHAMLQKEFELMCDWMNTHAGQTVMTFEKEVKIAPELQALAHRWDLHSHCDGVFTFWHEGVAYLRIGLEIKTKSGPEFEKLKRPDEDHAEQTCFYMAALDLPLMWLLYYNKSNQNMTRSDPPYMFQFDRNLWTGQLMPRIQEAHAHRGAQTLPDRVEGSHCRWCNYSYTCQPTTVRSMDRTTAVHNSGAFRPRLVKP